MAGTLDVDSVVLSSFFGTASDLLAIADFQGRWLKVSKSWTDVLGWSEEEILNSVFPELVHPDDVAPTIETNRQVRHEGLSVVRFDNRYRRKDGTYQWLRWTGTSDADDGLIYAIAHPMSDTEKNLDLRNADLETGRVVMGAVGSGVITTDLAGVVQTANVGALEMFGYAPKQIIGQHLSMLVAKPQRGLVDDEIHRILGQRIPEDSPQGAMELTGVTSGGGVFAIAMTLSDCTGQAPLVLAVVQPLGPVRAPVVASGAAGAATDDPASMEVQPQGAATEASVMHARGPDDPDLARGLQRALKDQQFVTHYQPVVTADGTFIGMEALLRWQPPGESVKPAFEFIIEAERSLLIGEIGKVTIESAIRDTAALARADCWPAGARCSINLSPSQLGPAELVAEVAGWLAEYGASGEMFAFEITEHAVMDNDAGALAHLDELRGLGCRVVLDDFGTGYASMSYLHRLRLDGVKIDRSFVQGVDSNAVDAAIVSSQISLASLLDLEVVAEGVETERQLRSLQRRGCRHFQGWLFDPALPIAEIRERLLADRPDGPDGTSR